jgi:DNA-directed RNA polymerase specialized sigma24 family protein
MAPSRETCQKAYRDILRVARRCTRSAEEAQDLAQDALAIALARGFEDWPSPSRRGWLRGVVRRRAALLARGEARRRRRERLPDGSSAVAGAWTWQQRFLQSLPRSLRVVAALASADLSAAEIRCVLNLSEVALRQRLSALRRAVRAEPETPTLPAPGPQQSLGARRAQLLAALRWQGGQTLAACDPDGHPIVLCVVPHKTRLPGNSGVKEPSPCANPS